MKRILFFLFLLVGLSAGAQDFLHLERYAAANDTLAPAAGARVVLFGDSITDGWARKRPAFFADNGFIGRGIGGETTANMLLRFRADVIDIQASTVVILAGVNDIAHNLGGTYNEDATFSNLQSMVDLCWQNGIRPVLCSLLPSYWLRWRQEETAVLEKVNSLNARVRAYCQRHGITYVDYFQAMAGPDGKMPDAYSADTVHPNEAGYEVMEKVLLEALR